MTVNEAKDTLNNLIKIIEDSQKGMTIDKANDLLNNLIEMIEDSHMVDSLKMSIKALEQTMWNPCSEGLPEDDDMYLLFGKIIEDEEDDIFIGGYDAGAEKFGYREDYYDSNTLGFLDSELIEYNNVMAWMPLPKSYKNQKG